MRWVALLAAPVIACGGAASTPTTPPVVAVPTASAMESDPTPPPAAGTMGDVTRGQAIFQKRCTPCHGEHAQGRIGPNLTDDCFLHGRDRQSILQTITEGVPTRGMVSWRVQLREQELEDVAEYVHSLQGTYAPGGRPCQEAP